MFNIDNLESYINDALNSWHGGLTDPLNPAMKFIGENGELIDYLAKCIFKPNFKIDEEHIISEAGDAWYYFRLLAKIHDFTPEFYNANIDEILEVSMTDPLALMAVSAAAIYASVCSAESVAENSTNVNMFLVMWISSYLQWLEDAGFEFDEIHKFNVDKLSGPTNHGWKPNDTSVDNK